MRVTVGVVGYGYWGSKHVRVLQSLPGVDVIVIERETEKLGMAHAAFPHLRFCEDLDEALLHLDAAVLATSPSSHAPLGGKLLEAGVHVLIEKPLATSSADAMHLIQEAERRSLVLMVGHTFEYNPAVQFLQKLVTTGELGEIRYIDSARLNLGLYQPDVNVIWDLAPHDVSITNYLLGSTPRHVSAWATRHVPTEFEDVAYLQLEYADPAVHCYVHVSWLDPRKVRRVTVVGSDKMAVYNDVDANEPIRIYDVGVDWAAGQPQPERPLVYRYGSIVSPPVRGGEPLAIEDRHFLECVRTGRKPLSDGYSGLAVVQTIESAIESAALNGQRLDVDRCPSPISVGVHP